LRKVSRLSVSGLISNTTLPSRNKAARMASENNTGLGYEIGKLIEDLNIDKLFNKVFEKKIGVLVAVNKNPLPAKQLKEKNEKFF